MKRLVLGCVVLIVCGGAALWLGWPSLVERLRTRLERELSGIAGSPSRVDEMQVSLLPLSVHLGGLGIGAEPALVQVGRIDARLWIIPSLMEWRPVVTVRIGQVAADLTHLPKSSPTPEPKRTPAASGEEIRFPPLQVREFALDDAQLRFRMGKDVAHLTVGHLTAHVATALLGKSLAAGLEAQAVELERKAYRARIAMIQVQGGVDGGGLYLDHGSLEGDGISVSARAAIVPHRHTVSGMFDPGILGVVVDELSFVGGEARVEGELIGDLANPLLDARLTIDQGAIGSHVLGDLDTHVSRAGPTLRFDDLHLAAKVGSVAGAVELTVVHEVPIHGDLTWQGVDLEGLLRVIGTHVPFRNRVTATTAVHGALDPLDLDVRGTGVLQTVSTEAPKEVGRFDIGGHILPHNLDATLEVTQAQQNRVTAEVTITGKQFGGRAALKAADLRALDAVLPRPVSGLALTGQGDANAEFSGTTDHPVVGGSVVLRNLTILGAAATRLAADFRIAADTLTVNGAQLETTAGGAELGGVLALNEEATNDWRVRVRDVSNDLWVGLAYTLSNTQLPISSGTLNGAVTCKGRWQLAELNADLVAASLRVAGEPLDRVQVKATTALPRWTIDARAVRSPAETLTIEGAGEGDAGLQLSIDSTAFNLTTLRGAGRRHITGVVALQGRVSGALRQPSGALDLTGHGLGADGHQLGDFALHADGKAGEWGLKGAAFDDTLSLNATLKTVGALPFSMGLSWQDTDLSRLVSEDRSLGVVTTGAVNLSGAVRTPESMSGSLRVTRFEVTRDAARVELAEPAEIRLGRGRLTIGSLVMTAAGSRLSVTGQGRPPAELDLDVQGEGDLVLLEVIGRPFYSARGQFGIAAHIGHTAARGWTLKGQASLRGAALDLGLPVAFTDTNGDFSLLGANVLVQHFAGRTGGGQFHVTGKIRLKQGPALSWWVHDVGLTFPEWLEERMSGKGEVRGTWQDLAVSGDVEVLSALYDKKIELSALIPWFKEQITPAPRIEPPSTAVHLDLRIHAPDGVFVDNNFAKAEMSVDMRVSGTATSPLLDGKVEILSGEATVGSRVFTLTGGSAVFQPGERINPVLNLTGESRISGTDADYTVRVAVSGTAENPRVQFSSDEPGLSQNDVLSLVTLGRTTREQSRDSGVGVGDVLSLLPTEYTGDVSQGVRTLFRVDRFEVDPAYVRNTGSIEPRVTIGKDLTDRIRALASTSFGVDAHNTIQLEYRITGRISLLTTWESASQSQAGAFGGDIKFRYEFRRIRFSLLNSDPDLPQPSDAH